jgi:hypothetical protein
MMPDESVPSQATPKQATENRDSFPSEVRLSVRLSPEVREALDWIATNRGITAVEAVRRAIGTEKFFLELKNQKAKIFVQVPGEKHLKEVVFENS